MSSERYHSNSQQRILKVMLALAGHEVTGLAPGEIAKGLNITPSNVTRDLANLRIAGLAEQITDSDRWRLTPKLSQIGLAMLDSVDKARRKVDEVR
ncbi:MAG TPA: MarR family transcriptional regulator, partial [Gammaproteobacteria bacterium]|nr:MarR family transcriptional regulator [Gammaproteobacteria bacterium]